MSAAGAEPVREPPDRNWAHYELWDRVRKTIDDVPLHFRSTITITGIRATEIYTFGEALGTTIEQEILRTLNDLHNHWDDQNGTYAQYEFVRQPQNFPDVLLRNTSTGQIVMGIELKSWYLLAKEGEPSFRFKVTPAACEKGDLLVLVPWTLSNVMSGAPMILKPYVELARYMAIYRNHWWQNLRKAEGDATIRSPPNARPYPSTRDEIADDPVEDKGNNFGRIARMGLMDAYVRSFDSLELLGIELRYWRDFFKTGGRMHNFGKQTTLPTVTASSKP